MNERTKERTKKKKVWIVTVKKRARFGHKSVRGKGKKEKKKNRIKENIFLPLTCVCGMAEEILDYDEIYIFSKDRGKLSENSLNSNVTANGYNTIDEDYVNLYDQQHIISEKYQQKSLPNLKNSSTHLFKKRIYSESDPLLGSNGYTKAQYICGGHVRFTRYKRTQIFLFFFICFYVAYLIVGSVLFQQFESNPERLVRDEFRAVRAEFLDAHPEVKGEKQQQH